MRIASVNPNRSHAMHARLCAAAVLATLALPTVSAACTLEWFGESRVLADDTPDCLAFEERSARVTLDSPSVPVAVTNRCVEGALLALAPPGEDLRVEPGTSTLLWLSLDPMMPAEEQPQAVDWQLGDREGTVDYVAVGEWLGCEGEVHDEDPPLHDGARPSAGCAVASPGGGGGWIGLLGLPLLALGLRRR